jgi:hypothetical protein
MHGQSMPQAMADQGPRYEGQKKKKARRENQVIGKSGIIRPDKRKKQTYL